MNIAKDYSPLVSVIIPCYNAERYLAETLESVLVQTHTNWECVIVDDHSTDNSFEIIQKYCSIYPNKFRLYNNSRKGACAARNVGFENSRGEYIQFLDADDLLDASKIEKQISFFKEFGNNIIVNGRWGRFYKIAEDVRWEHQIIDKDYQLPINWLMDSWMGKGMSAQHAWLIPRELIERAGSWNEKLLINQDGEFFCRVLLVSKEIKFCNEAMVYYRSDNVNSIGKQRSELAMASQLTSYFLYEKNIELFCYNLTNKNILYKAIASQLSDFYIRNRIQYPALSRQAKDKIEIMNQKLTPQGGTLFKIFCYLFGIDLAILFRKKIIN